MEDTLFIASDFSREQAIKKHKIGITALLIILGITIMSSFLILKDSRQYANSSSSLSISMQSTDIAATD